MPQKNLGPVQWLTPIILALGKPRREDCYGFKAKLNSEDQASQDKQQDSAQSPNKEPRETASVCKLEDLSLDPMLVRVL